MPPPGSELCVALDATPLLGPHTGVAEFCVGALEALAARGDVCTSAYAVTWRRRHRLPSQLPAGVRPVQRAMPARPLHLAWRHLSVPPAELFLGRPDVVHGTNYVVPPTHRAARVVTVHDLTTVRFPELCDRTTLTFPDQLRRAVRGGAWVHTPSQFVADEVLSVFDVDPERVRAVPHGVPRRRPGGDGAAAGSRLAALTPSLPEGTDRYVLAVGTIEPRKDYPGLVRAFDRLADERRELALVIAGGEGWGTEALDAAVSESVFKTRVVRTGYVDDNRLSTLLAGAAVLAFPSRYEGFGFPPLEAMAAGVPVVATAVGAVPEVVGDAGLLVPAGDVDELAGALRRALDDTALRDTLTARGRARAAEFTWERCADGLVELYRAAAAA